MHFIKIIKLQILLVTMFFSNLMFSQSQADAVKNETSKYVDDYIIQIQKFQTEPGKHTVCFSASIKASGYKFTEAQQNKFRATFANATNFFTPYNMGGTPKIRVSENSMTIQVGYPKTSINLNDVTQYLGPLEDNVLSNDYNIKKSFGNGSQQDFTQSVVESYGIWTMSKPVNFRKGVVKVKRESGKIESLDNGTIKYTRIGPGEPEGFNCEAAIYEGNYTIENISSGHYKIELIEPGSCAVILDENKIIRAGFTNEKDEFVVTCDPYYEVTLEYSYEGKNDNILFTAYWPSVKVSWGGGTPQKTNLAKDAADRFIDIEGNVLDVPFYLLDRNDNAIYMSDFYNYEFPDTYNFTYNGVWNECNPQVVLEDDELYYGIEIYRYDEDTPTFEGQIIKKGVYIGWAFTVMTECPESEKVQQYMIGAEDLYYLIKNPTDNELGSPNSMAVAWVDSSVPDNIVDKLKNNEDFVIEKTNWGGAKYKLTFTNKE